MPDIRADPRPIAVVADDNPMIRMDAADILEDAGYRTIEAEHGDHAFDALCEHHPEAHLLFTDVQMPNGTRDGFALARDVAANWPHIAILVASGELRPGPADMPKGATFISKPFSAQIVHERLKAMLPEEHRPPPLKG